MRMFDSPTTHIIITSLSCIVATVNIFLIYVIWKHSPKSMGTFKLYMLKMAVTDLLFASSIAFLFLPNLVFPLPGAIAAGLLKYFGRTGAVIAYIVTMVAGGMTMLSVNDCCLFRIFIFYKMDKWIEFMSGKKALFHVSADFLAISLSIGILNCFIPISYKELQEYAKRHGLEEYMPNITPETPIVAYDLKRPLVILSMAVVGLFLLVTGGFNIWSNYKVHNKINESKSSMSKETYRMQRSLTFILLAQAVIPGVSIAIPILIYEITIFWSLTEAMQSPILEWFAVLIIGAYPFVNSCFCLYSMKPYRKFTKYIGKKLLFCVKWNEDAVIMIEPTAQCTSPITCYNTAYDHFSILCYSFTRDLFRSYIFSLVVFFQSLVEWLSVQIIGTYSFVNSCFCLYHMKAYRKVPPIHLCFGRTSCYLDPLFSVLMDNVDVSSTFSKLMNKSVIPPVLNPTTSFPAKMRMFDSPTAHIVVTCLSCPVLFVNLLLIYAIWKHSPKSMGIFKLYMLKMAITDFIFASSIAFLFLPNLVFPLPGAIAAGLLQYFGRTGALIAYVVTMVGGGMTMLSVNDCCLYRIFVFYKLDKWVEFMSSKKAILHVSADLVAMSLFIGLTNYIIRASHKELQDYAERHGLEEYMANITPETPIIAYDFEKPSVIFSMVVIGSFLLITGGLNVWSNYKVHKKINESKSSMSEETYKMQRSLTFILLTQAVIPGFSIAIPILIYEITIFWSLTEAMQSPILEWFSVIIIGAYPFVNSCICLYSMKPYREFTKLVGKKILCCMKWREDAIIVIDPSGSSSTL